MASPASQEPGLIPHDFTSGQNIRDKVIVITGANTGIGFETAKDLAQYKPKKIVLACRDVDKGLMAATKIKDELKVDNIDVLKLDLNDLNSVKEFAGEFNSKYD